MCPISRREMRRPVKNLDCGHVYDRASVEALMNQSQGMFGPRIKCPVVGCRSQGFVTMERLRDDMETRRAIDKKRKKK